MKLLLDIGNTRIKVAAIDASKGLGEVQAVVHAGEIPREALEELKITFEPQDIWVSCVAGPVMQEAVVAWADDQWGLEPNFVATTATAGGVRNAYAQAHNLGIDRWLAVIAAHHRDKTVACVVDAGTCITLDVVDAKGQHLGGLIAPGVTSQRSAVWGRTQVRAKTQDQHLDALAASTDNAVSFGTLHSALGMIERVLGQLPDNAQPALRLLTGGEAELLIPHLPDWEHAPDLVLEGLAVICAEAIDE